MRRVILAVSATVVGLVLLLGFKTQSSTPVSRALTKPPTASSPYTGAGSDSSSNSGSGSSSTSGTRTATGTAADTRYGPVQVKVTMVDGKITVAEAIEYPSNDPRDQEINSFAIPQLQSEAVTANSAQIDMVSGATYTSEGYVQSLQSALDQLK